MLFMCISIELKEFVADIKQKKKEKNLHHDYINIQLLFLYRVKKASIVLGFSELLPCLFFC